MSASRKCTGCGADAPANVVSGIVRCAYCGATFQIGDVAPSAPAQPQVVVVQVQAPHASPQASAPAFRPAPAPRPYAPPRRYVAPPAPARRSGGCAKTIVLLLVLVVLAAVAVTCVGFFFVRSAAPEPPVLPTYPSDPAPAYPPPAVDPSAPAVDPGEVTES